MKRTRWYRGFMMLDGASVGVWGFFSRLFNFGRAGRRPHLW